MCAEVIIGHYNYEVENYYPCRGADKGRVHEMCLSRNYYSNLFKDKIQTIISN